MVFNVLVGFQNVELKEEPKDPKNKVYADILIALRYYFTFFFLYRYSMLLADTVLVTESGDADVLTKSIVKAFADVSYFIEASTLSYF